jgi:hypothetical protein
MIKLPETVTGKMCVLLSSYGTVFIGSSNMEGMEGYTCLSEQEITLDVPQEDPTPKVIEGLEDSVKTIQAEAAAAVREIMDKIQQLKCLEHKGES